MSDITKARFFLKHRDSGLDKLESFGLMYATAEKRYRDIRMRQAGNDGLPGSWDVKEAYAALDYALLRYLKKHNQLPKDAMQALLPGTTLEKLKETAQRWANS